MKIKKLFILILSILFAVPVWADTVVIGLPGGTMSGSLTIPSPYTLTLGGLTATRVPFAGTGGLLQDDADMTFNTDTLTVAKIVGSTSITNSGLTATRVTFAGVNGLLSDDADMTFATDTLTVTKLVGSTSVTSPTIYGSAAANGDITIHGTSHTTKDTSYVILQPDGGQVLFSTGATGTPSISFNGDTDTGIYSSGANEVSIAIGGVTKFTQTAGGTYYYANLGLGTGYSFKMGDSLDVVLFRDAADVLALVRSTNPQTLRFYGSYTDASNYEYGYIGATAGAVTIGAGTAGTGSDNIDIVLSPTGTGVVKTASVLSKTESNGQSYNIKTATTTVNSVAGTTLTASNLIPASSMVVGVTIRITTGLGTTNGLTSIAIGDGTDVDRWGTGIAITANTTTNIANFTISSPVYYTAATNVVITGTGDGGNEFDTTGVIRITVHYIDLTAATS